MKITFKRTAVFLSAAILLIIGIGCSKSTVSTNTQPNIADGGTAPKATPTTTVAKAIDIAGNYAATGTNVGGGGNYMADLTITKRDDVYQFSWQSGPNKYDGVGVRTGDSVAVAFTEGQDGKGCGVVLYKIEDDGSLNGKAGYWGVNTAETETAKRAGATAFEGKYDVTGKNSAGGDYTGKLDIKQSGEGYDFVWDAGSITKGFGIREGDKVAVGIGGDQCGFVLYEAKPDGTMSGKWGGKGSRSFGTENLKKK